MQIGIPHFDKHAGRQENTEGKYNTVIKSMKTKITLTLLLLACCPLFAREYPIKEIVRVIDGDTVDVVIDLGFGITINERLRLYAIDAWETRGKERELGLRAKDFLNKQLSGNGNIWVEVPGKERGKYGRVLAVIYINNLNVNQLLVEKGHAKHF